ncbi:MAG TPA: hypothetical protein GXZ28_05220 [Clostridiales bacterium]|nr:hypothetical protein [Clostridiales bacterium]
MDISLILSNKTTLMILIFAVLILLLFLYSFAEKKMLVTKEYILSSNKLGAKGKDRAIVVLADLHNNTFGKNNSRLIKKIDQISPDYILIAGDLITKRQPCSKSHGFSLLQDLLKKYSIYYGYGNHEQYFQMDFRDGTDQHEEASQLYRDWMEYKRALESMGVKFLDNESVTLPEDNLKITGLTIDRDFFSRGRVQEFPKNYINSLVGDSDSKRYQILLAHNPVYFHEYCSWGADLTLSGHVHGGLVRLPLIGGLISPQVRLFPKYSEGSFTKEGKTMVVSRGLGSHSCMIRIFNPPELVIIRLNRED